MSWSWESRRSRWREVGWSLQTMICCIVNWRGNVWRGNIGELLTLSQPKCLMHGCCIVYTRHVHVHVCSQILSRNEPSAQMKGNSKLISPNKMIGMTTCLYFVSTIFFTNLMTSFYLTHYLNISFPYHSCLTA